MREKLEPKKSLVPVTIQIYINQRNNKRISKLQHTDVIK